MNDDKKKQIKQLAKQVIDEIKEGGESYEKLVEAVNDVFLGFINGINKNWEQFIAEETNASLAYDKVCCPRCNLQIEVDRTHTRVYTNVSDNIH